MNRKYITVEIEGIPQAIAFRDTLQHIAVWAAFESHFILARPVGADEPVLLGAGYIGEDGRPCGMSDSLKLGPGPDDDFLLAQLLTDDALRKLAQMAELRFAADAGRRADRHDLTKERDDAIAKLALCRDALKQMQKCPHFCSGGSCPHDRRFRTVALPALAATEPTPLRAMGGGTMIHDIFDKRICPGCVKADPVSIASDYFLCQCGWTSEDGLPTLRAIASTADDWHDCDGVDLSSLLTAIIDGTEGES